MILRGSTLLALLASLGGIALAVERQRFPLSAPSEMREVIPGQLLVKFSQAQAQAISQSPILRMGAADGRLRGATFKNRIGPSGWTLWLIDPSADSRKVAASLYGAAGVAFAQPVNRVYPLILTPNDGDQGQLEDNSDLFLFGEPGQYYRLWHLDETFMLDQFSGTGGAFALYPNQWFTSANRSQKARKVGFVDTGADLNHPDFANAGSSNTDYRQGGMLDKINSHFWRFGVIDNSDTANDEHGHGTHVMGLAMAAGNNGSYAGHGTIGASYQAIGSMQRVFDDQGVGTDSDAASAIYYLADLGTDVINVSLGTENFSQVFQDAVTYAWNKGSTVVVAGNEDGAGGGDLGPIYPAACSGSLGVTANGPGFIPAVGTYAGSGYYVDVAAPGGDIVQVGDPSDPDNFLIYIQFVWSTSMRTPGTAHANPNLFPPYELDYAYLAGTSMACPIVSGAAAMYMEKNRLTQATPWGNLKTYQAIERAALGFAPNGGWESVQGFGSLDAEGTIMDLDARQALIGGCEGIVYINGLATSNIQIKAQRLDGTPAIPYSTTTKPDGTYRFDGMPPAVYRVWTQGGAASKQKLVKIVAGCDQPAVDFWLGTLFFDSTGPTGFCQLQSPGLSTTTLQVTSFGRDTETGIDRMTFRLGTTAGASDVIAEQEFLVGDSIHTFTGLNLNPNNRYWVTYRMWNGAGMMTEIVDKYRIRN